jgi:hypothetical protein
MLIAAASFELVSGNLNVFERSTDSGGSALCYFCPTCGNRVYHESPQMPGYYRLKPGGLDDTSRISPQAHVWTSRAQTWYEFTGGVPVYETQPDLKEFLAQILAYRKVASRRIRPIDAHQTLRSLLRRSLNSH